MQPKLFYNQVVSNFHLARSAENGSISFVKLTKVLLRNRNPATFTTRSKKQDWARFLEEIARKYRYAEKITMVMDNLNTHKPGSLYETFKPKKAKTLLDRFEFIHTPKHGSWLNMAEIELRVLSNQCLNRRIDTMTEVRRQVSAWEKERNNKEAVINWRFTTDDARIKLKRLYPSV